MRKIILIFVLLIVKNGFCQDSTLQTQQNVDTIAHPTTSQIQESENAAVFSEIEDVDTIDNTIPEKSQSPILDENGPAAEVVEFSSCNPPCPKKFRCDSILGDCVPDSAALCSNGETFIDWRCVDLQDAKISGLYLFIIADLFFVPGTIYNAVTSYKAIKGARVYWDKWDSETGQYIRNGFSYDNDYAIKLGPPATGYTLGGALLLGANSKQSKYLKLLNEKKLTPLNAAGAALYGLSIGSNTWNFIMIIAGHDGNKGLVKATSYINVAVLASSLIVNNLSFILQKIKLKNAVQKIEVSWKRRVDFSPYVYCDGKVGNAGLVMKF